MSIADWKPAPRAASAHSMYETTVDTPPSEHREFQGSLLSPRGEQPTPAPDPAIAARGLRTSMRGRARRSGPGSVRSQRRFRSGGATRLPDRSREGHPALGGEGSGARRGLRRCGSDRPLHGHAGLGCHRSRLRRVVSDRGGIHPVLPVRTAVFGVPCRRGDEGQPGRDGADQRHREQTMSKAHEVSFGAPPFPAMREERRFSHRNTHGLAFGDTRSTLQGSRQAAATRRGGVPARRSSPPDCPEGDETAPEALSAHRPDTRDRGCRTARRLRHGMPIEESLVTGH